MEFDLHRGLAENTLVALFFYSLNCPGCDAAMSGPKPTVDGLHAALDSLVGPTQVVGEKLGPASKGMNLRGHRSIYEPGTYPKPVGPARRRPPAALQDPGDYAQRVSAELRRVKTP